MSDEDELPDSVGKAVLEGAKDGVAEAVRGIGRSALWGGSIGGLVGLVAGLLLLGPPGLGIGLLIGIPGGALLGVVTYYALTSIF